MGRPLRRAAASVVLLLVVTGTARPAAAAPVQSTDPACDVRLADNDGRLLVDGIDALAATTEDRPLRIDVDEELVLRARSAPSDDRVQVEVRYLGLPFTAVSAALDAGRLDKRFTVAQDARLWFVPLYGLGTYQVEVTGPCPVEQVWVELHGRHPLLTPVGALSFAVVAGTLLALVVATLRAARRGIARRWGWVAGMPFGLAAEVLAHQVGFGHADGRSAVASSLASGGLAAVVQQAAALTGRLRADQLGLTPRDPMRQAAGPTQPRFLQAGIHDVSTPERPTPRLHTFRPGARHRLTLWIGPPEVALRLTARFPDEHLPQDDAGHDLTVLFSEATCLPTPVVRGLVLPPTGASTRIEVELDVPLDAQLVAGRITILHRNRVLQTALLRGLVDASDDPARRIELVPEVVVRANLDDLTGRTRFDGALVLDTAADGATSMTAVQGTSAHLSRLDGLDETVEAISERLSEVAADPDAAVDLTAESSVRLLRYLAMQGSLLRDKLLEAQVTDHDLLDQRRLQVLSLRPEAYLPLEFIYDYAAPAADATLCPNAVQALRDGHCTDDCAARASTAPAQVICPMGFWCVNRVIERHATRPDNRAEVDARAEAVIDCDPTEERHHLAPLTAAVVAFSEIVDRVTPPPSAGVVEALTRVTDGRATVAHTWQQWREIVQRERPNLLVLLSHTIEDTEFDQPGLEIGTADQLLAAHLDTTYVRAPDCTAPPVVLLLGCETALSDEPFEQFMTSFQQHGASIVVGTLATVLGYHAAPVASALVDAIAVAAAASSDDTFGDVLTATRRSLLAQGLVMGISLTAYGDADWRFTTEGALQ